MSKYVYLGESNNISPFPPKQEVDEHTGKVRYSASQSFKRGRIYDITDKDEISTIKSIDDFIAIKDLPGYAGHIGINAKKYDDDEILIQAILWVKYIYPNNLRRAKAQIKGVSLKPPVEIHTLSKPTPLPEPTPEPEDIAPPEEEIEPDIEEDLEDEPDVDDDVEEIDLSFDRADIQKATKDQLIEYAKELEEEFGVDIKTSQNKAPLLKAILKVYDAHIEEE